MAMAVKMWDMVRYLAPDSECWQLRGNHDERPMKRILKRAPEYEQWVSVGLNNMFNFPGVFTKSEQRDELIIQLNNIEIMCFHGWALKQGQHLAELKRNIVFGHTHYGWTHHLGQNDTTISELNCGYIANRHAFPMSFTRLRSTQKWTQGLGLWDQHGPRFIPFGWT